MKQDKTAQETSPREEGTAANQLAQSISDFFTGIAQSFDYLAHWAVGKEEQRNGHGTASGMLAVMISVIIGIFMGMIHGGWWLPQILIGIITFIGCLLIFRIMTSKAVGSLILGGLSFLFSLPTKILVWSAGADYKTLRWLENNRAENDKDHSKRIPEIIKYAGLGMSMFVPATLGFLSFGYLVSSVFGVSGKSILLMGIVWASIIFVIDRTLVIGMKRGVNGKYSAKTMMMRFLLAMCIGVVITVPIELKVFEQEINEHQNWERTEYFKTLDESLEADLAKVDTKIEAERSRVDELYDAYQVEVNTSIGGRKPGHGPEAKIKLANWQAAKMEFETRHLPELKREKNEIELSYAKQKTNFTQNQSKGIGSQLEALHAAGQRHSSILAAHIVLFLFFLFLELIPVLVKWFMPPGPYEFHLQSLEAAEKAQSEDIMLQQQYENDLHNAERAAKREKWETEKESVKDQYWRKERRNSLLQEIKELQAMISGLSSTKADKATKASLEKQIKAKLTELSSL